MSDVNGLRVLVQGDLNDELMTRVSERVREAVLRELAEVDLAPRLEDAPLAAEIGDLGLIGVPFPLGLWLKPVELAAFEADQP